MDYLDFDIEIRAGNGPIYSVSVRSLIGEGQTLAAFPFTDAELETHLLRLENAILRSAGRRGKALSEEERTVQTLGQQMFEFLLAGELRALYYECQSEAAHRDQGVRVRLHVQPPQLAVLPWEFLYDPRRGDYLCLDPYTPLVRYLDLAQRIPPLAVTPPLRILGMVASPRDLPPLDVEQEKQRVERALHHLSEQGSVELTWAAGPTWRDLQRVMRPGQGPWHIFHFIGHGGVDLARDEGFVLLADEQGQSRRVSAVQLGRLLAGQRYSLRLAILNACEGARGSREGVLSSTAATLMRSGLPAVLAMQYAITDTAAVEFARSFYDALADSSPMDTAVADARNAINLRNESSLEWGTPVLYMRTAHGRIFALRNTASSPPPVATQSLPAADQTEPPVTAAKTGEGETSAPASVSASPPGVTRQASPAGAQQREAAPEPAFPIKFDWVTIPAGEFLMGSDKQKDAQAQDDELPQQLVYLPAYRIARVPVTNAQYKVFVEIAAHQPPSSWQNEPFPQGKENHPVVYVDWYDVQAFCRWAGVRLPTEAEWEKAARSTDGRNWPWGNDQATKEHCNFVWKVGDTTPVGTYPKGASPYGVLDMAGNVWEWTSSLYQDYPYQADDGREDPSSNGTRTLRGGSLYSGDYSVRCAARVDYYPSDGNFVVGFRVVSLIT